MMFFMQNSPRMRLVDTGMSASRFDGRYAQILNVTVLPQDTKQRYTTDDKGVVYNERHVPMAQQGVICVYMPLLPHRWATLVILIDALI